MAESAVGSAADESRHPLMTWHSLGMRVHGSLPIMAGRECDAHPVDAGEHIMAVIFSPPTRGRLWLVLMAVTLIASLLTLVPREAEASVSGRVASDPTLAAQAAPAAVVDIDYTASEGGYWVTTAAGEVIPYQAPHFGHRPALAPGEGVAALGRTESGAGYWLFTDRGRVFPYGDAKGHGDAPKALGGRPLAGRIVDAVPTSSGNGYYMLGSDGGIFSFGDARFHGSVPGVLPPGRQLDGQILGLAPTPTGKGYWLVAEDGGLFSFGDAAFYGSIPGVLAPGRKLDGAIIGMVGQGTGYLMVGADGGIFNFGRSRFHGSVPGTGTRTTVAAVTTLTDLSGYLMVGTDGQQYAFGAAKAVAQGLPVRPSVPKSSGQAPALQTLGTGGVEGGSLGGTVPPAPPGLPSETAIGPLGGPPAPGQAPPDGGTNGTLPGGTPLTNLPDETSQANAALNISQPNYAVGSWAQLPYQSLPANVGRIYGSMDGVNWRGTCTGTVIGRDQVLTAGHCLYSDLANGIVWKLLRFYPDLHGSQAKYGYWMTNSQFMFSDPLYIQNRTSFYVDYGIFKVGLNAGRHIGDVVGMTTVYTNGDSYAGQRYTIGYPAEGLYSSAYSHFRNAIGAVIPNPYANCSNGSCLPYYCVSPIGGRHTWGSNSQYWKSIGFGCYLNGGWSGGPIYSWQNNRLYLVSVTSTMGNQVSCGTNCRWYGNNMWGPVFRYERFIVVWNAAQ